MEEKQESDKFLAVRRSKRRLLLQWCLSVCSSVTLAHCAQTAEGIGNQ